VKLLEWFRGGWNGHTRVITVLTVAGVIVALAAWLYPKPDKSTPDGTRDRSTSGASSTTAGGASDPPTTSSRPQRSQIRYLSDMPPVTGGAFVSNGGPAGPHALVIQCGSGQSNDRSREVSWNVPGEYSTLLGTVTISGKMDPEHNVQLEWFADGARIYNNSTLTLGADSEFRGELVGAQDLRVRLTCTSSAGIATLLDASVQR
jgi:hypothetical protein